MDTAVQPEEKMTFIELGAIGTGTIQPAPTQSERLDEITRRVSRGEFHKPTSGTIPCTCIDGRFGATEELMPNAAGGSETLMVADDLTSKRFATGIDSTTCSQYQALLSSLKAEGLPIGGHTAADCHGAPSGCGANDKLPMIYAYIVANAETLRGLATELLGYDVDDETHNLIIKQAAGRTEFSDGADLLNSLKDLDGRVDVLEGEHTEVMAVINRRIGTTLDRDAVREAFGETYEVFNVDEWSFSEGARVTSASGDDSDAASKRIAMVYYNFATAGVLCGPRLRVVILQ